MNPDYYKTNHKKTWKHELDRVMKMDDNQLETRYGKMTKQDKIGAFYEALTDQDRAKELRKKMEGNHSIGSFVPPTSTGKVLMQFIKVLNNDADDKKALFYFSDTSAYYLYTYIHHEDDDGHCTMDETETFLSDKNGEILNSVEIFSESGYIESTNAMNNTVAIIESGMNG
jgi:hypothetical protein